MMYLKEGNKIHIKKKNRGKFTASAKRAGMSVQEYAQKVLNDPNATPLQKRRANFARNAKRWHPAQKGKKGLKVPKINVWYSFATCWDKFFCRIYILLQKKFQRN